MPQYTHKGPRQGTGRQPELAGRDALLRSAPTEPETFLLWSSQRKREDGKFELSRGRVTCDMINASRTHGRVARNLVLELGRLLDLDAFDISAAGFAVRTPFGVRSPDVVVDRANSRTELSTSTPTFIAEILSPSAAGKDFTEKLKEYSAIDALQPHLICSQDGLRASVWARQDDGSWPVLPEELAGRDGTTALGGLDVELAMAAIFRGISDAPTVE